MGLADRFRESLEKRNIFEKRVDIDKFPQTQLKHVSKPITSEMTIQTQHLHSKTSTNLLEHIIDVEKYQNQVGGILKFEDLETEIINKIRKTPYWHEYTDDDKTKMIGAYFDKKMLTSKYRYIKPQTNDRTDFIQNILALSNNK